MAIACSVVNVYVALSLLSLVLAVDSIGILQIQCRKSLFTGIWQSYPENHRVLEPGLIRRARWNPILKMQKLKRREDE